MTVEGDRLTLVATAVEPPQVSEDLVVLLGDVRREFEGDGARFPDAEEPPAVDPPPGGEIDAIRQERDREIPLLRGRVAVVEMDDEDRPADEPRKPAEETHEPEV